MDNFKIGNYHFGCIYRKHIKTEAKEVASFPKFYDCGQDHGEQGELFSTANVAKWLCREKLD